MSKKMVFLKATEKLTAGGSWDNGLYVVTSTTVEFPLGLFEQKAIIESIDLPFDESGKRLAGARVVGNGLRFMARVHQVTVDGRSWVVIGPGTVE